MWVKLKHFWTDCPNDFWRCRNLQKSIVYQIVKKKVEMWKICAKLVPRSLTDGQKETLESISRELLECVTSDPKFLKIMITRYETSFWVWSWNKETEFRLIHIPISSSKNGLCIQVHIHCFLWQKGNSATNAYFYKQVLQRFRIKNAHIHPDPTNNWILPHDNAPVHTSFKVTHFFAKHHVTTLHQTPYIPDLSHQNSYLFPRVKCI